MGFFLAVVTTLFLVYDLIDLKRNSWGLKPGTSRLDFVLAWLMVVAWSTLLASYFFH
jgi:hypothetical protein